MDDDVSHMVMDKPVGLISPPPFWHLPCGTPNTLLTPTPQPLAPLCAQGTPTHMSPELFMAGHVSKASDVYAYGILLYEIITGQRAYAGVPVPLLPHQVAVAGLRPSWPPGVPAGCKTLQQLAEACWAQAPQDRWAGLSMCCQVISGSKINLTLGQRLWCCRLVEQPAASSQLPI